TQVSWYEPIPETSLSIIARFNLPKDAAIIDIGGGDSLLVDYLLLMGYSNITVLDISAKAIERAQARLGEKAQLVTWLVRDVLDFTTTQQYDLWHDRAAFHFFTDMNEQERYLDSVHQYLKPNGYLVLSTFSTEGPETCSGLPVQQYSENSLSKLFNRYFEKIRCFTKMHITPFHTVQSFVFCSFQNTKQVA
ncbi:MAG TPA: class I SAM-dependent methyltransferase, partial [Mucilaginibacter sp.]|nr:class I SAM-dependent methyltransferase [Mucilaginibacter sp.]